MTIPTFEPKQIKVGDNTITILPSVNGRTMLDFIELVYAAAEEKTGLVNPVLEDMAFHVRYVQILTDLEFEAEDFINLEDTYDKLNWNNIIDIVVKETGEIYEDLLEKYSTYRDATVKYHQSIISLLQAFISDLPAQAEAVQEMVNNFDPDRYKEVLEFKKSIE